MSGPNPVFSQRDAQPMDDLMAKLRNDISLNIDDALMGAGNDGGMDPEVAKFFYGLTQSGTGRKALEFLCDIAVRRNRSAPTDTLEDKAMAFVRLEEGQMFLAMISMAAERGRILVETKEPE